MENVRLIKFYADWCGPCRISRPTHQKVASQAGLELEEVNIDDHPELASQYDVMSIPHVIKLVDGKVEARSVGAKTAEMVKSDLGL